MNETTDKLLRDLAGKLGTTVEHLWGVIANALPTMYLLDTIGYMIGVLIILSAFYTLEKLCFREMEDEDERAVARIICGMLWGIPTFIFLAFAIESGQMFVVAVCYPEFAALKYILGVLK